MSKSPEQDALQSSVGHDSLDQDNTVAKNITSFILDVKVLLIRKLLQICCSIAMSSFFSSKINLSVFEVYLR